MTIHIIELYESLKSKLGEKEAKDLLVYIHETVETQGATPQDLAKLEANLREAIAQAKAEFKDEIGTVKADLGNQISQGRVSLKEEIGNVKLDLSKQISQVRTDLKDDLGTIKVATETAKSEVLRWMFGFWVGQLAVMTGILFAFFRR